MSKSLLQAFNIETKNSYKNVKDYDVFKDKELLEKFRIQILENLSDKNDVLKLDRDTIYEEIKNTCKGYDISNEEYNYLYYIIDNEINGYGPLTEILKAKDINEIMVNGCNDVYIENNGKIVKDNSISFINDKHIIRVIQKLISNTGKSIDVNNPMVDAILEDGSRVNAIVPPISSHPTITIRKFKQNLIEIENLVGNGTLTPYMAEFLSASCEAKLNIIISGSSSSGKTSLLNTLSNFINKEERIITIEDARELNLKNEHVVSLETKIDNTSNLDITIRDLVKNSLRMRPDRIIIGEIRGDEAFDLLQAMNTGCNGSMTTMHANSPKDALNRLETMTLMSGIEIPIENLRDYINQAIDLIVHMERMKDGKRKITSISEITGIKDNELIIKEIFNFDIESQQDDRVEGKFTLNKYTPKCLEKIHEAGITSIDYMFKKK